MEPESEPADWVEARDAAVKSVSFRAGIASFLVNAAAFGILELLYKHEIDAGEMPSQALDEMRPGIFIGPVVALAVYLWVRYTSRVAIGTHSPGDDVPDRLKVPGFWWRSFWLPVLIGLIPYIGWIGTVVF